MSHVICRGLMGLRRKENSGPIPTGHCGTLGVCQFCQKYVELLHVLIKTMQLQFGSESLGLDLPHVVLPCFI